jgi:hypothetical protein
MRCGTGCVGDDRRHTNRQGAENEKIVNTAFSAPASREQDDDAKTLMPRPLMASSD